MHLSDVLHVGVWPIYTQNLIQLGPSSGSTYFFLI